MTSTMMIERWLLLLALPVVVGTVAWLAPATPFADVSAPILGRGNDGHARHVTAGLDVEGIEDDHRRDIDVT
jgi:hypothetical protein